MSVGSHRRGRPSPANGRDSISTDQPDLFRQLERPTLSSAPALDLDIHYELLGALNTAIRQARTAGLSRERIVDAMNRLLPELDKPVTLRQINAWTAASKVEEHTFPLRYLAAFCSATNSEEPLRVVAAALGFGLVDAREMEAQHLGENLIQSARLRRVIREQQTRLGG